MTQSITELKICRKILSKIHKLANSNFALQIGETTYITGKAQLIAFVRFIHKNDIINQFSCCRELPDFTTGKHIFDVISSYLEQIKVSWKSCIQMMFQL